MTRKEAEARTRSLNLELGAAGCERSYSIEVEESRGVWTIEKRTDPEKRPGWLRRLWDAFLSSGAGP